MGLCLICPQIQFFGVSITSCFDVLLIDLILWCFDGEFFCLREALGTFLATFLVQFFFLFVLLLLDNGFVLRQLTPQGRILLGLFNDGGFLLFDNLFFFGQFSSEFANAAILTQEPGKVIRRLALIEPFGGLLGRLYKRLGPILGDIEVSAGALLLFLDELAEFCLEVAHHGNKLQRVSFVHNDLKFEMSNVKYQSIVSGNPERLTEGEMLEFKVHCSGLGLPLDKWIDISLTLYKTDPSLCLQLLLYVEKHELTRAQYRDFQNQNAKITIYNNLAAIHLGKAVRESSKEESDRLMLEAKRYLNLSEKVRMIAGRVYLTLRSFIFFYEGNFELSAGNFNKSIEKNSEDQTQSVIGVLGLAQLAFAKRNYESALNHYKMAMKMNKGLPTKARLGMAYCFYELEKHELAKACFKRILDLDPGCIEALIGYGTLCYHQGDKDVYFNNLEMCYRLNKSHPLVLLHLAEHMLLSKNLSKLVAICERGLESLKGFPVFHDKNDQYRNDLVEFRCRFYHILGQLYHQSGEHETCLKYYNQALNPHLLFVHINLAQAYTNPTVPQFQEAMKLLTKVHSSIPPKYRRLLHETYRLMGYIKSKSSKQQAIQFYSDAVKHNPHDFEAHIEYANLLIDSDYKRSLGLYSTANEILLKRGETAQPELYNNLAVMSLANELYDSADNYLNMAFSQIGKWVLVTKDEDGIKEVKEKGFAAIFHFNRAVLYEETSRFEECLQEYSKAIQINPYFSDVYIRLALLAFRRGNTKESFERLDQGAKAISECRVIAREIQSIDIVRSWIYKQLGDQRSAKSHIAKYKDRQSYAKVMDDSLDFDILMQKTDSNTLNIRDNLKGRIGEVLRVCETDKHNVYQFMILATMLAELGKFQQALDCFNQIKQYDQQHPIIMYNLGILYYKMENYEDAVMTLKRYLEKGNRRENFRPELSLAIILFLLGKYTEAIRVLKKLILVHPSNLMLRYNLNLFLQKSSEINLDQKNKEIKKTKESIAYLRRCFSFFNHFPRFNIQEHLACVQNLEAKQKLRIELSHIIQKAEDQKLYIKSREERYTAYEIEAKTKETATTEEYNKIVTGVRERIQQKKRQEEEQKRRKAEENEKRRLEKIMEQTQLADVLNQQHLENEEMRTATRDTRKAPRHLRKSRKNRNPLQDSKEIRDEDLVADEGSTRRKFRLIRQVSEESSEEKYTRQNQAQTEHQADKPHSPANEGNQEPRGASGGGDARKPESDDEM